MKKYILTLILATLFTLESQALFIEPYAGYERGVFGLSGEPRDHDGMVIGGRLGTEIAVLFFAGLDVMLLASGNSKTVITNASADMSRTAIGAVFGVDLPLIKAWIGYNFQDNFTFNSAGVKEEFNSSSQKIGVGFGFLPLMSLNLEYINTDISKYKLNGTEVTSADDANLGTYLLSVSFSL